MKVIKYTLLFLTTTLLVTLACRRDDDCERACTDPSNPKCPNYDPCFGVEPPSATFTIQESIIKFFPSSGTVLSPDDSFFVANGDIFFTSPFSDSKYKHTWYLGSEIIHDASFSRDHINVNNDQRPYHITISHVLEYPLDNECFSNATGKDSVARTYTLIKYLDELNSFGVYRGAFEGQRDSFNFAVRSFHKDGGRAVRGESTNSYISNFHNEGDTLFPAVGLLNKVVTFSQSFGSRGLLIIEPNSKQFILEYRHRDSTGVMNNYTVSGRKLNLK